MAAGPCKRIRCHFFIKLKNSCKLLGNGCKSCHAAKFAFLGFENVGYALQEKC